MDDVVKYRPCVFFFVQCHHCLIHSNSLNLLFQPCPPKPKHRLDRIYTLSDEGFREVIIVEDHADEKLPACFPDTYGDEFERRLLEELEGSNVPTNVPPGL
jgi:hypothetical protein